MRFGRSDAEWHRIELEHPLRKDMTGIQTACGKDLGSKYFATREPKYEEPLCRDGCFTPHEIKLAKQIAATEHERDQQRRDDFDRASEERVKAREEMREKHRQRLTGEHPTATDKEKP